MKIKNKIALLFFVLSIVFALVSIPFSAALSRSNLERRATAKVVNDENGILKLKGFANNNYDLNGSYKNFGAITNNSNQNILLTITINPDYSILHLFTRFGLRIGSQVSEFTINSSSPKQITVQLSPGQEVDVQAYLTQNLFHSLNVDFQFNASDITGTYTVKLSNTSRTPRNIVCY
jgi:hypothetical protein